MTMLGVRYGEIKPGRSRSHGLMSHLNRQEKPEIFKPLPYRLELMPGSEIAPPAPEGEHKCHYTNELKMSVPFSIVLV